MAQIHLKSFEFRREREKIWRRLERLVNRVESGGLRALKPEELSELPELYRATLSSLSVARTISLDRNLLDYLEALSQRAYVAVYGSKRPLFDLARDFFVRDWPRSVRALRWEIAFSASIFLAGVFAAYRLVLVDGARYYSFVDPALAGERGPQSTRQELLDVLYAETPPGEELAVFSAMLFNNNANVGLLAFALGFLGGLPTAILLLKTGLMVGAFWAIHAQHGISADLWGWLLIHGVTELSAIVLFGAAGFGMARALIFPGRMARLDRLKLAGRDVGQVALGGIFMMMIAGVIEGVFRQTITDRDIRYIFAGVTAVLWSLYFCGGGRQR
jgi:uncharacterized membrane protein SpoIIM required for sporulation